MRIYLCSRIAFDARSTNERVARALRKEGYEVFVPHEASYNQADNPNVTDEDVYRYDMAEMLIADAAVIVGRIGVDCAFEAGWFQNQGVPTVWFQPPRTAQHPMLFLIEKVRSTGAVLKFLKKFQVNQRPARKGSAA